MRQKFVMNAQRHIRVPSRPNKRSKEEIVEIDGELLSRANRFGGRYQPLDDRITDEDDLDNNNNNQQQPETIDEENEQDSEDESQIIPGDNFPIVDERTRSSVYTYKPSNRQNDAGQKSHGRRNQEGRIHFYARPKNTKREIQY